MPGRFLICLVLLSCGGCGVLRSGQEVGKTLWGSSTRALEEARSSALSKTYDRPYWDVFRAAVKAAHKANYVVFIRDEVRGCLVLMGVQGSVNTTEVGLFFVELSDQQTRVEISSLSTNAKRMVAKRIFKLLDIAFGLAAAGKEPAE